MIISNDNSTIMIKHEHPEHRRITIRTKYTMSHDFQAARDHEQGCYKSFTLGRVCDEDMTSMDTTIDYKVCSFLHMHSIFRYNSLGSTCTCRYLNVGTNVSQSASPSKLNFWFVGNPIVLHWKGHNSSIRSAIEVNEHLMESLFDKLSNISGPTSISHWQCLQIIKTFCHYFHRVLRRRHGLVIHTWDPSASWSTPQEDGEPLKDVQGCPTPWPPP
jgi:hypothetical protein